MSQLLTRALLGHTLIDLPTREECPGQNEEGTSCCHHSYLLASPSKEGQIAMMGRSRQPNGHVGRFHRRAVGMATAAVAAGADGLIIEVHPDPDDALSDGAQILTAENFSRLMERVRAIALASGKPVHPPLASPSTRLWTEGKLLATRQ